MIDVADANDPRLWRAALREMRSDPARERLIARREQTALLGAAMAFSAELPRRRIRAIAHRSNVAVQVFEWLCTRHEAWRGLVLDDEHHLDAALAHGRGAILAPAHFGRYLAIVPALLARGHRTALLADAINEQAVTKYPFEERWQRRFPNAASSDVTTIAVSPTSLWHLARALRERRIAIVFADGNMGIHAGADQSCLTLPFLGRQIVVRTGIAALSFATGAPILPVFPHEPKGEPPRLRLEAPIRPHPGEPALDYRARAMTALFVALEREVRRTPAAWEEWSTFTRWVIDEPPAEMPVRPTPASLPALAGARLALANPWIWAVELNRGLHVVDVRSRVVLASGPRAAEAVLAAERDTPALDWVRARDRDAFDVVVALVSAGALVLRR